MDVVEPSPPPSDDVAIPALPPLTWLFVPADRSDRVAKAISSRAHAVIVDLEDAVAPEAKAGARAGLAAAIGGDPGKPVLVRVNAVGTPHAAADAAAVAALGAASAVVLAKVRGPDDVEAWVELLGAAGRTLPLHCLIESAAGVEAAFEIAGSRPEVAGIALGEADLSAETGAAEAGLDWARARIVNAACAAGLPRPPQSVFPNVRDGEGLRVSCLRGRALGHLGRLAIHPDQLAVIEQAYLPSAAQVEQARAVLDGFAGAAAEGVGAIALAGGAFVDEPVVRAARQTLALAGRYGAGAPGSG